MAIITFLFQAGLIATLLVERRLRRVASAALEESQRSMTLAARAADLSMSVWDVQSDRIPEPGSSRGPSRQPARELGQVLETVHPEDREALGRSVRDVVAKGDALDVEYRTVRPDGEVRWVVTRGRAESGRLVGVTLDVTPRKLAELQAERDRTALRHMSRVSTLGQLSASIAHQMNQPLAAILGNAEALQKILAREPIDLEEVRAICGDVVTEGLRAAEVIRHLRTLFRRRSELQLEPIDMNRLVFETLDLVRSDFLARHVRVVTELAPTLPTVDVDRVQMQQVLLNLVLNAADAVSTSRNAREGS